jgi:hypothetical protein
MPRLEATLSVIWPCPFFTIGPRQRSMEVDAAHLWYANGFGTPQGTMSNPDTEVVSTTTGDAVVPVFTLVAESGH